MKKITIVLTLALCLAMTGCGNENTNTESSTPISSSSAVESKVESSSSSETETKPVFEEKDGLLVYTDLKNSPFEQSGFAISIKQGDDGYANFIITDLNGNETKEYYKFDFSTNTVEQYYYVSAMGTGFYYTFDLTSDELVKVEDDSREDSTESTKKSGRFDGAAERTKEGVHKILDYFKDNYGKSIEDMVKNK